MSARAEIASHVALPGAETIATLVNRVTTAMLEMRFELAVPPFASGAAPRIALLPLKGTAPLVVALSSDQAGCAMLGAALMQLPTASVDSAMMDDTLRELANMIAGLIRSAMRLDQALGLPQVLAPDCALPAHGTWTHYALTSGLVRLVVSVTVMRPP